MGAFLSKIWAGLKALIGLVLPIVGKARAFAGWGATVFWVVHVLLVAAICFGLHYVHLRFQWNELIDGPRFIKDWWLTGLFLLIYAEGWLGYWLYKLLAPDDAGSDFPDIDDAWREAMGALAAERIELTEAPLFLVLGRPAGPADTFTEAPVFAASQIPFRVKGVPAKETAPLHVYATADGIFVSCTTASLLSHQAELLASTAEPGADSGYGRGIDPGASVILTETLRPQAGRGALPIFEFLQQKQREGRSLNQLDDAEKLELTHRFGQDEREFARQARRRRAPLSSKADEMEIISARLEHLCRLISRDRRPWCPINGLLLLLPVSGTDSVEDAKETAKLLHRDLETARTALKVRCPGYALVCDMEALPGFHEFAARFSEQEKRQRLGQRFPLVPVADRDTLSDMAKGGVSYLTRGLFTNWAYRHFKVEAPGKTDLAGATVGNTELFRLVGQMAKRQDALYTILNTGILDDREGPPLFGGCYIAGTGRDARHQQAFVAGVFRRLMDNQDFVTWTDEALIEDARCRSWARWGYVLLGLLVVAAAALVAIRFLR